MSSGWCARKREEVSQYTSKYVDPLLSTLLQKLILERPDDPVKFLQVELQRIGHTCSVVQRKAAQTGPAYDPNSEGHSHFKDLTRRLIKIHSALQATSVDAGVLYHNRIFSTLLPMTNQEYFQQEVAKSGNTNGEISTLQLYHVLSHLGLATSMNQAKAWMSDLDTDGDSGLSEEEFCHVLTIARHKAARLHEEQRSNRSLENADCAPLSPRRALLNQNENSAIFLGGSCNPTTWRQDIVIPIFEAAGLSFFNPQVDDWYPELLTLEATAKLEAQVLFYVIDPQTRALASMIEATELILANRTIVLIIQDMAEDTVIAGDTVTKRELVDINRARAYLADCAGRHDVRVFKSIVHAARYTVELFRSLHSVTETSSYSSQ